VHRAADGVFLGTLTVTLQANGLIRFAPDAQLVGAAGGDGTLSKWRVADFTVVHVMGSGYQRVVTVFNFSANGAYQSAASGGRVKVQRRTDATTVRTFDGGGLARVTPALAFSPDSSALAFWGGAPNTTILLRISDGAVLRTFPAATAEEGVVAIRFTLDGGRLVTTGYLPYQDADGLWQQVGVIRFWRVADGALRNSYHAHTGLGVTSPVAWSPDGTRFLYGTYEGTAVAAVTPSP
jgi:WD40 repeat protein